MLEWLAVVGSERKELFVVKYYPLSTWNLQANRRCLFALNIVIKVQLCKHLYEKGALEAYVI